MKKVRILVLLVLLGMTQLNAQDCFPSGITLTTQQEIDDFATNYPACTEIQGSLFIGNFNPVSNITNVNGLSQITSIGGSIYIRYNPILLNLSGLENLTSVNSVSITNNAALASLSALSNSTIVGNITVSYNPVLTSLEGLNNLTTLSLAFIENNDALTDLTSLSNLQEIDVMSIFNNSSLTSLEGLNNLTTVDQLDIYNNEALVDITSLSNLQVAINLVSIVGNNSLTSLNGLDNLATVKGVYINNNNALTSITSLSNLQEIIGLEIKNNSSLSDLTGLDNLTTLHALNISSNQALSSLSTLTSLENITNLTIQNNDALSSIDFPNWNPTVIGNLNISDNDQILELSGLDMVTSINELILTNNDALQSLLGLDMVTSINGLSITNNDALQSLSGLSALTTINYLNIANNPSLTDLTGFSNVENIGGQVWIYNNDLLESLTGFGASDLNIADTIRIGDNELLSVCAEENICNHLFNGGILFAWDNAPGCNSVEEIFDQCLLNIDHTSVIGKVIADLDLNCDEGPGDFGIPNILVQATNDDDIVTVSTDSLGNYWMPLLAGDWTFNIISPSDFWSPCTPDVLLVTSASGDTVVNNMLLTPPVNCPFIDWDLNNPPLTICSEETFVIDYCNYGAMAVDDLSFAIQLDSFLVIQSASIPYTIDPDGRLLFEIDTLDLFECGQFTFNAFVDCDSLSIGDVQCVEVEVLPDELCSPNTNWDGATISVNGVCENDSIHFELNNIGTGNMSLPSQFRVEIVIDDIVLLRDVNQYQLNSGKQQILSYELDGWGMRLETQQTPGHPVNEIISTVVPNCTDEINNVLLTLLPLNNGDPYMETFCSPVVAPYDPNAKSVLPIGLGEAHEIETDWELHYTLQFQNTGNDTAVQVVLRDTLSENLDLSTLAVGGASHSFTWALNPGRELVFTFDDIYLPDSTTNLLASQGFAQFSITPKSNLLPGEQIFNEVEIYFDFNAPVITNTVFHTIRQSVIASSEQINWCQGTVYEEQFIWQDTSIQYLTELAMQDSIHFVNLIVSPLTSTNIITEIPSGSFYEGVLILSDTSFVLTYMDQFGCDSLVNVDISVLTDLDAPNIPFQNIDIYPNPVNNTLYVSHHKNGEIQHWTLFNSLGALIHQQVLQPNASLAPIAFHDLPVGVYLLKVKTPNTNAVWKIVNSDD